MMKKTMKPVFVITVFLFLGLILHPGTSLSELSNSENRPFWTQKTCYREGEMIYGIGVATGEKSLEKARKRSFEAALWEVASFAQLDDTALLMVETQMTYEEEDKNALFSVWRLVKISYEMLQNAKTLMKKNRPLYQKTVDRIRTLERDDKNELANELRRVFASNADEVELKEQLLSLMRATSAEENENIPVFKDMILPEGKINGFGSEYLSTETVNIKIIAEDNETLESIIFSVNRSGIKQTWKPNKKSFEHEFSFQTKGLNPGENHYTLKIIDGCGNSFVYSGKFRIIDLKQRLQQLISE